MFASMGDSMPPCGVPLYVLLNFHSSTYPALAIFLMTLRNFVSSIFFSSSPISILWSMLLNDRTLSYPCQQPTARRPDRSRGHRPWPSALRSPCCVALDPPAPAQYG